MRKDADAAPHYQIVGGYTAGGEEGIMGGMGKAQYGKQKNNSTSQFPSTIDKLADDMQNIQIYMNLSRLS